MINDEIFFIKLKGLFKNFIVNYQNIQNNYKFVFKYPQSTLLIFLELYRNITTSY
jgi:hypothetical protein